MASGLSANTIFEVRNTADFSGASDTNGGGFVTGASGTDYAYANVNGNGSAKYALSGLTSSGSGNTLLYSSASADMVGNLAYCASGTNVNTGQWYQIASVSVGASITFSTSNSGNSIASGTASGVAINIGGALATPGLAASLVTVSGMQAWIKFSSTKFTFTTSTAGSGGPWGPGPSVNLVIEGYDQERGDRTGNQPYLFWGSVSAPGSLTYMMAFNTGANAQRVANLIFDGNSVNNVGGINSGHQFDHVLQCTLKNFSGTNGTGITLFGFADQIAVSNCALGVSLLGTISGSTCSSCTTGFAGSGNAEKCLASSGTTGFANTNAVDCCTADSCATGFSSCVSAVSCIASNCSAAGAKGFSSCYFLESCFGYNNTTHVAGATLNERFTSLTQSPYVGSGSFAPNSTSGGGASLRGAGLGVVGQTENTDAGAVQHADPSGAAGGFVPQPDFYG